MAYADPLDETKPAGNEKRKLGDDTIRTHIRALRQRLASIFVNVDTDPLALKPNTVATGNIVDGNVTTVKIPDLNITTPKLADRAVTAIKAALAFLLPEHIGAGTFLFDRVDSTAGYRVAGAAPLGQVLRGNGADFVASPIQPSDFPIRPHTIAWASAAIAVPNDGAYHVLALNTEDADTSAIHDPAVNSSRFTVPAALAGLPWRFHGQVQWSGTLNGFRRVALFRNGAFMRETVDDSPSGIAKTQEIDALVRPGLVAVGDYFELAVECSGAAGATSVNIDGVVGWFEAMVLS